MLKSVKASSAPAYAVQRCSCPSTPCEAKDEPLGPNRAGRERKCFSPSITRVHEGADRLRAGEDDAEEEEDLDPAVQSHDSK